MIMLYSCIQPSTQMFYKKSQQLHCHLRQIKPYLVTIWKHQVINQGLEKAEFPACFSDKDPLKFCLSRAVTCLTKFIALIDNNLPGPLLLGK